MTTQEAFEALVKKYPTSKIQTWDWMTNQFSTRERDVPDHNFSVTVDGRSYHGDTLEEAVAAVRMPTPAERAAALRAQAQKNLDEAAALEAAQPAEDKAK